MASKKHIRTMVFCPVKQKMVDKGTEGGYDETGAPMIIGPLEPFISPITGEVITSRDQLRRHNKAHGVTNIQDYSQDWFERKSKERHDRATGNTPEAKAERIQALREAVNRRR